MRWAWLGLLTACGGSEPAVPAPDAAQAVDLDRIDIIVSSRWVYVFPQYSHPLTAEQLDIPDIGGCGSFTRDWSSSYPTALTSIVMDGIPLRSDATSDPFVSFTGGVTTATVFHATDAGRTIDVPIHAGPYVGATDPVVTSSDAGMTVQWNAAGADSVFVGTAGGIFGLSGCRVSGTESSYTFQFPQGGQGDVYVEAFATPEVYDTTIGPVRVFYGDVATTPFGM